MRNRFFDKLERAWRNVSPQSASITLSLFVLFLYFTAVKIYLRTNSGWLALMYATLVVLVVIRPFIHILATVTESAIDILNGFFQDFRNLFFRRFGSNVPLNVEFKIRMIKNAMMFYEKDNPYIGGGHRRFFNFKLGDNFYLEIDYGKTWAGSARPEFIFFFTFRDECLCGEIIYYMPRCGLRNKTSSLMVSREEQESIWRKVLSS